MVAGFNKIFKTKKYLKRQIQYLNTRPCKEKKIQNRIRYQTDMQHKLHKIILGKINYSKRAS